MKNSINDNSKNSEFIKQLLQEFSAYINFDFENDILKVLFISYCLTKIQNQDPLYLIQDIENDEILLKILKDNFKNHLEFLNKIVVLKNKYLINEDLKNYILNLDTGACFKTSCSVYSLISKFLNIQDKDEVLDVNSDDLSCMIEVMKENNNAKYTMLEYDENTYLIAYLKNLILKEKIDFENILVNQREVEKLYKNKFNKVIIMPNSHFSMQIKDKFIIGENNHNFSVMKEIQKIDRENKSIENKKLDSKYVNFMSIPWKADSCLIAMELLKNDPGAKVSILVDASLCTRLDVKHIRKKLCEEGYLEAVIQLPKSLFEHSSMGYILLILSRNNKKVRVIDAKDIYSKSIRRNELTQENVKEIYSLNFKDSEISKTIDIEFFSTIQYVMRPSAVFFNLDKQSGLKFNRIIKKIYRGSQVKGEDFNYLKINYPTIYRYLTIGNINDGLIEMGEDQYLRNVPENMYKYKISNNSIILSKVGNPKFKSAILEINEDEFIIANGNLIVIELYEDLANPYYILALLQSDYGEKLLYSISSGNLTLTLSLNKIKNIVIPLPSKEKQDKIAQEYKIKLEELEECKKQYKNKLKSLKNFDIDL